MTLAELDAILFDFDGVIIESNAVKTEAFGQLFEDYPEHQEAIRRHHLRHLGISRFEKFRWIYEQLLGQPLSDAESARLGERFSRLVEERVMAAPWVPGARELLRRLQPSRPLFVVSGTPQDELSRIVRERRLNSFFREVHGSPPGKPAIVRDLLERHRLTASRVLLIGDGLSDLEAAAATGLAFIARQSPDGTRDWPPGTRIVPDLRTLLQELTGGGA